MYLLWNLSLKIPLRATQFLYGKNSITVINGNIIDFKNITWYNINDIQYELPNVVLRCTQLMTKNKLITIQ